MLTPPPAQLEAPGQLKGRYAWALARRRGADQLLMWFTNRHSKAFAHLVETGVLHGKVFDEPQQGESSFGGSTQVRVLLENLSDEDVGAIIDRRAELFGWEPWLFTRLRGLP